MIHGVLPNKKDHRDWSYWRTFHKDVAKMPRLGSVILSTVPDEFNFDAGLTMPDQNADGLFQACTAYAQTDICIDEDKVIYNPRKLYDATMDIMGIKPNDPDYEKVPCDVRSSLKAVCNLYKRGGYFDILNGAPFDTFDTIRFILWSQKRTGSIGTPWLSVWENISSDGIIPETQITSDTWHNYKFCGTRKISNVLYLVGKSWQGRGYGNGGFVYFSRITVNNALAKKGSFAYTLLPRPTDLGDIQTVKLDPISKILSYLQRLIESVFNKKI